MTVYKNVADVVAKLADKDFCEPFVVEVNKGSEDRPRFQRVIEWTTACAMLDEVFGPFGWDAEIVNSTSDYANGLYTVDLTLTGRAIDEEGVVVELKRPGRGIGLVPRSALNSDSEHDRQSHGVKSDAITNATKALGKGFGLYLYSEKKKSTTGGRTDTRQENKPAAKGNGEGKATEKQLASLKKNGAPMDELGDLSFSEASALIDKVAKNGWKWDASFAPTAVKKAPAKAAPKATEEPDDLDDFFGN